MKRGPHSAEEAGKASSSAEDRPLCNTCTEGFVDITELLRKGLASLPAGLIVGGEGFSLEECFHAAELPLPLEDKEIWRGAKPQPLRCAPKKVAPEAAARESDTCADEPSKPPSPSPACAEAGLAPDGSTLLPYLRLQLAAALGRVPLRVQIAVMQRLLLWLLALLRGSSPPRTFLRCVFFKKPFAPVLRAWKEGRWGLQTGSKATPQSPAELLALTNNLPLLQAFCAVYARLCMRIQALNDFGGQEMFVQEEDCELCSFSSPWNGLMNAGWQDGGGLTAADESDRETLQQYTDRVEQTCVNSTVALWGMADDVCLEELLQWGSPEEGSADGLSTTCAFKTRQDFVMRTLLKEAERFRLYKPVEDQQAVRNCCRFLCCLALLVEALIAASDLEKTDCCPYDFAFYLAEGVLREVCSRQEAGGGKAARRAAALQSALSCIAGLLDLLRSDQWLLGSSSLLPNASSREASAAKGKEKSDAELGRQAQVVDTDLCFTPLFAHYRDPIEMTAAPVPSVSDFCGTMSRFLELLQVFICGNWQPLTLTDVPGGPPCLPGYGALPHLLMDDLFVCFAEADEHRLRALTWDLAPPLVPPFPQEMKRSQEEEPCVALSSSTGTGQGGSGSKAAAAERPEVPTALLRVFSYTSLTSIPQSIEREWLAGRLRPWRLQGDASASSLAPHIPDLLEFAFGCICWGCRCEDCELWGRWRWSLQEYALCVYSTLHMALHRQLRHLQRMQKRPQVIVEETIRLLAAESNSCTPCLKEAWRLRFPPLRMKAQAFAVAFDALLLQQQHFLALTIRLQLTQPIEDIVIYWSLLGVLISSQEVSTALERGSTKQGRSPSPLLPNSAGVGVSHFSDSSVLVASCLPLSEGKTLREVLWPIYCVRCAPLYLAVQPLCALRNSLKEAPYCLLPSTGAQVELPASRVADIHSFAKLAGLPAEVMARFSFEALCKSVEFTLSTKQSAIGSATRSLEAAVAQCGSRAFKADSPMRQATLDSLHNMLRQLR
ncbi:hypothetical protein Efla_002980 [Eimeria flavescens]